MAPIRQWSKLQVCLFSLVALLAISYADYVTGDEFLFFVFYFIPVALCGWYVGWRTGLGMAALSGLAWLLADLATGHRYRHEHVLYWNAFTCFLAFSIIGLAMHALRHSLEEQSKARRQVEAALANLQQSTEEVRKLQTQLQVVCGWTKRIRIDERWLSLDEFLRDKLGVQVSHGISPEAFEEIKRQLESHEPNGLNHPGNSKSPDAG